ncbi:hypothetical protein [Emticicia agri]|uniref:Uncharacterized protein n=1 Tax=Emticicia agri TaxID=2492393 RepID=A0A4V1ZDL8_9BACT|nr:hypothetical protein [Emticicia agri]RYU96610.1 hypothetical protein EWM59_05520 [Emticicia agri]
MKLLPFETIILETKLNEEEIINRLTDFIESEKIFRLRTLLSKEPELPYEGKIEEQKFKIQRITGDRLHIFPVITGNLENVSENTLVKLRIRLSILT